MSVRCIDGYLLGSGDGEEGDEVAAVVDRRRECVYFANTDGTLSERYCSAPGRVVRAVIPRRLHHPHNVSDPKPSCISASDGAILIGYNDGAVLPVDPISFNPLDPSRTSGPTTHTCNVVATCTFTCEGTTFHAAVDASGVTSFWDSSGPLVTTCSTNAKVRDLCVLQGHSSTAIVFGVRGGVQVWLLDVEALLETRREAIRQQHNGNRAMSPRSVLTKCNSVHVDKGVSIDKVVVVNGGGAVWGAGDDGLVRVYDVDTRSSSSRREHAPALYQIRAFDAHQDAILQLSHSGNTVWSSSLDKSLAVWDTTTFALIDRKKTEDRSTVNIILAVSAYHDLNVWSTTTSGAVSMWCASLPVAVEYSHHNTIANANEASFVSEDSTVAESVNGNGNGDKPQYIVPRTGKTTDVAKLLRNTSSSLPPSVIDTVVQELSTSKELQVKVLRENDLHKIAIKDLETHLASTRRSHENELLAYKEREVILKETQDRNLALLTQSQEEIEDLKKRLKICADANANEPRLASMTASNKKETFIVATRRQFLAKLVDHQKHFATVRSAVRDVETEIQKVISPDDEVREYMVGSAIRSVTEGVDVMEAQFEGMLSDFVMAKEKQDLRMSPDLSTARSLAADRGSIHNGHTNSTGHTFTQRRTRASSVTSGRSGSYNAGGKYSHFSADTHSVASTQSRSTRRSGGAERGRSGGAGGGGGGGIRRRAMTPPARLTQGSEVMRRAGLYSGVRGGGGGGGGVHNGTPSSTMSIGSRGRTTSPGLGAPRAYISPIGKSRLSF